MERYTIGIIKPATLRRGDDKGIFELMSLKRFIFLCVLKKDITSCSTTFDAFSTNMCPEKKEEYTQWYKGHSLLMVLTHLNYDPVEYWKEVVGSPILHEASPLSIRGMYSAGAKLGKKANPFDDAVYASEDMGRAEYDLRLLFPKHVVDWIDK